MNIIKTICALLFLILTNSLAGQQKRYVKAENGLIVRDNPSKNSERTGKLEYGTSVMVLRETDIELNIQDGQEEVSGQWVEIKEIGGNQNGYVFSGYLTSKELSKKIQIKFQDLTLEMDLEVWDEKGELKKIQKDSLKVYPELGETPEGKKIKIKQSKFKKIEVFQRHENSVTIMNEGPHCDLTEWKHYYSKWKELSYNQKENTFISDSYEREDREKFISVSVNELMKAVKKDCGGYWPELIENIKNVNEYPSGVSMSRIFFKIVLTDENDLISEITISFEFPMGC